jgi:hypothetical protein
MDKIYHGSSISGLKTLKPKEAGHSKPYVYATSKLALACIFCASPRSSLEYRMSEDENENIIFCERFPGVFDKYYKNLTASIYVLDKKDFFHLEGMHPREMVCDKKTKIVEEIRIDDMKEYLLDMDRRGELVYIPFEKRLGYFPEIDEEVDEIVDKMIDKYGKKRIKQNLKDLNLFDKIKNKF